MKLGAQFVESPCSTSNIYNFPLSSLHCCFKMQREMS